MKQVLFVVIFVSGLLFMPGCAVNSNRNEVYPSLETLTLEELLAMPFEELLAMSDVQLAATLGLVKLIERDGAYYLDPSDYKNWEPQIDEKWSYYVETPIENVGFYSSPYGEADIEKAALFITKRYIHYMMNAEWSKNTSFLITAYKDLSVTVYTEDELPEEYSRHIEKDETQIEDTDFTTWYVVPSVSYRFIGEIKGVGNGSDLGENEWVTDLGGNKEICLSLTKYREENYSMCSTKPAYA